MDNIIQLDTIRLERHKKRKCTCDPHHKKFTVDKENREITCECGLVTDPFEAMHHLARYYEGLNAEHRALNEQRQQWLKEKPYSVIFKKLERDYQRGTMLPFCPECRKLIDFKDFTSWGNAEFYRKQQERQK